MKREELEVQLADAWDLEGPDGPVDPKDISEMLRSYFPYTRMLAVAWLILHYEDTLHSGHWPQSVQGVETSKGGAYHYAPQDIPSAFAAIISSRLEACLDVCGTPGELCRRYYRQQPQPPDEAEAERPFIPAVEQCKDINDALNYCATWRERHCSFTDWRNRNYSRRQKRKVTRSMTQST